jgi:hypothetical protein
MKITRLTTHWEIDQVISLLEMLDEIRQALLYTYQPELQQYQQQHWEERQQQERDNLDLFDDNIDF